MKSTKAKIKQHIEEFETEVKLLDRKTVRKQNVDMIKSLNKPLQTLETNHKSANNVDHEIDFPVSTVAMYRNYTFIGRETDLDEMTKFLLPQAGDSNTTDNGGSPASGEPRCCILHGIGGVGKTQAALEYYYTHRKKYDAIFWLPAERDAELREAFGAVAKKLHLIPESKETDDEPKEGVERSRKWLENTGKSTHSQVIAELMDLERSWLLVFDNMEDVSDLSRYFPLSCKGTSSVIMTTQNAQTYPVTKDFLKLDIRSFGVEDGSKLLFKYLERQAIDESEQQAAEEISKFVEGLPLAIAAIGGYINQSRSQVQGFLENLKRSSKVWTASAVGPTKQYDKTLRSVFNIAFGEVPQRTREFLNILAFLDPDCIPEQIFTAHFKEPVLDCTRNEDE